MPDKPPTMRAATNHERFIDAIKERLMSLAQQPVAQVAGAVGSVVDEGFRGNTREDPNWKSAAMPMPPSAPSVLPMDEASRMARANDLGFTVDAYKGMSANVDGAPITEILGRPLGNTQHMGGGYAGFFTDDPSVANRFTDWAKTNAMTVPAKLKMSNPVVIDMTGEHAAAAQWASFRHPSYNAFQRALRNPKVDGIVLKNTVDEGTVYVPKNTNQIRSRFAAFDPSKSRSSDLLASSVGGVGLGEMTRRELSGKMRGDGKRD